MPLLFFLALGASAQGQGDDASRARGAQSLMLGKEALQGGEPEAAIPHLLQASQALGESTQGAEALYLAASAYGQLGQDSQAQALFGDLLGGPLASYLPPRMLHIAKKKGSAAPSPRAQALDALLRAPPGSEPSSLGQPLMDFASQAPDIPGLEAALAAAQIALEGGDWPLAEAAALRAKTTADTLPPGSLSITQSHTLGIVLERGQTENRRAQWAYVAGGALALLTLLGVALKPWASLKRGDLPILIFIAANALFAFALLALLYYLGLDPSDTRPLYAPIMASLVGGASAALALSLALALGLRGKRHGALMSSILGAIGCGATLYLFAYYNDYLPAFGL